jgi:hypothetical protein
MLSLFFSNWLISITTFVAIWVTISFVCALRLGSFISSVELRARLAMGLSFPVANLSKKRLDSENKID